MAVFDQLELTKWFKALEHGIKMEAMMSQQKQFVEAQKTRREVQTAISTKDPSIKMKKPMKTDHNIETLLQKVKEVSSCTCTYGNYVHVHY